MGRISCWSVTALNLFHLQWVGAISWLPRDWAALNLCFTTSSCKAVAQVDRLPVKQQPVSKQSPTQTDCSHSQTDSIIAISLHRWAQLDIFATGNSAQMVVAFWLYSYIKARLPSPHIRSYVTFAGGISEFLFPVYDLLQFMSISVPVDGNIFVTDGNRFDIFTDLLPLIHVLSQTDYTYLPAWLRSQSQSDSLFFTIVLHQSRRLSSRTPGRHFQSNRFRVSLVWL